MEKNRQFNKEFVKLYKIKIPLNFVLFVINNFDLSKVSKIFFQLSENVKIIPLRLVFYGNRYVLFQKFQIYPQTLKKQKKNP